METEKAKSPVNVSREDLYGQVWKTPLLRLAVRYGINGTGLSKICGRVDVPCPPAGYWAKLAAGKSVKQPPLPTAGKGIPSTVLISPTPERSPPPKMAADISTIIRKESHWQSRVLRNDRHGSSFVEKATDKVAF